MNSGYYLRGSITDWGYKAEYQFKKEGDILTLVTTLPAGTEFKIADESWSKSWGYGENDKDLTINPNSEYTLEFGKKNLVAGSNMNNVTLTFNIESGVLMVSEAGKDPDIKWYCAWNINDSWVFGNEMEKQEEGTYKTEFTPTAGNNYFAVFQGMNNQNWNSGIRYTPINQENQNVDENGVYDMQVGSDGVWVLPVQEGKGKWTVVVDPRNQAASTISFDWGSSMGIANVLIDRANDSDHSYQSYSMTAVEGDANAFKWTGELAVGDKLKFNIHGDDYYYDPSNGTITSAADATDLVIDYPLILGVGDVTFNYASNNVTILVDVDPDDAANSKVTVTIGNAPNVSMTVTNGENSAIYRVYKQDKEGIYIASSVVFNPGDQIDFRILDTRYVPSFNASYDDDIISQGIYSCGLVKAAATTQAPEFNLVTVDNQKMKVEVDATKKMVTFTWDKTTGVDAIEADNNGEAVYFNLQGVRVDNPVNGLFIELKNGKAVKVMK